MLSGASFSENSRRESKKRRRMSERRRVLSRLGVTAAGPIGGESSSLSQDRRRSSNYIATDTHQQRPDSPGSAARIAAANDQTKITMKIQFHITLAPENEPLILDNSSANQLISQQQQQQQKRQLSNESGSLISEVIGDRLNRLNSSTRKRQQLLAMHQQGALDSGGTTKRGDNTRQASEDRHNIRSGSFSATSSTNQAQDINQGGRANATGREAGSRSSTITAGIQDERTMRFLRQQQQQHQLRQASGSLTSNSASSLLGQHQTLMASSNNIRQRLEQREHIYFKRDGQRFGHEFTLKLAVDRNYRCLLKVRPLIPLQSISIHGHHVSFVDCSRGAHLGGIDSPLTSGMAAMGQFGLDQATGNSSPLAARGAGTSSNNTSGSSGYVSLSSSCPSTRYTTTRHQSIGGPLIGAQQQPLMGPNRGRLTQAADSNNQNHQHNYNNNHHHHKANNPICNYHQNNDLSPMQRNDNDQQPPYTNNYQQQQQQQQNSASLSSLSQPMATGQQPNQRQLIKQQQHHQMLRHFSASHGSGSHLGSQLVYMFDWSASRFEVTKNKARTTVQTVLKFKNGELLSLPLQIKFYQPECRQHLSWGSQLHFIDYECQINSMGQISVDRVQYY